MKYHVKPGIAACVTVTDDNGKEYFCVFMNDGKPVEEGVSGSQEDRIQRFAALPQTLKNSIDAHFKTVFDLPHVAGNSERGRYMDAVKAWDIEA